MAEINIERKERSALPWLIAGLLLLGLLWFLFARGTDNPIVTGAADSTYRDTTAAGALAPPPADTRLRDTTPTVPPR